MAKKWKFGAGPNLAANAHVDLSGAGAGVLGKVKDLVTGKMIDGIDFSSCIAVHPGKEVEADVVEFPERLQAAVDRGDLVILAQPEKK